MTYLIEYAIYEVDKHVYIILGRQIYIINLLVVPAGWFSVAPLLDNLNLGSPYVLMWVLDFQWTKKKEIKYINKTPCYMMYLHVSI